MKRLIVLFGLVLVVALAACGGQTPEATPVPETAVESVPTEAVPTAAPVEAVPTEAPSGSVLDSRTHVPDPLLIDKLWQWERRDPNGNQIDEIVVANPENYTLYFNEDGTFSAQVDCNSAAGAYATGACWQHLHGTGPDDHDGLSSGFPGRPDDADVWPRTGLPVRGRWQCFASVLGGRWPG